MADITPVEGSVVEASLNGLDLLTFRCDTAANGEDGVTYTTAMRTILAALVTANEDGKTGGFTASWSGSVVTIKALAGAPGDAAEVSVVVLGWRG